MAPHWWPRFRIGIAVRLTVAFVAVAVLAIAAFTLVESGPAIIQIVDVHPDESKPGSRPGAAAVSGEALLGAVARFGRATGIRIADDSPARVIEAKQAAEDLERESADYLRRARTAANAPQLKKLESLLRSQRNEAARLISDADARRQHVRDYERHFQDVDIRMKDAIDRAWKIFGRVVARQFMLDMSRTLDRIRPDLATLVSTGERNDGAIAAMGASEATFAAALKEHETTLRRTQGDDWFNLMQSDLAALANARSALDGLEDRQAGAISRFEKANARLAALVRGATPGLMAAAARTGPAAAPSRGPTTRYSAGKRSAGLAAPGTDKQITFAWLSIFTLALLLVSSVATMLSIIRPVRRLMLATRRLANGESGVVVARGGIRELDSLAVSFNQMAEQLAAAQAVTRQSHEQLEAKVEERTRQLQHLAQHDP
jgi:HAMP domain-containing protein